MLKGRPGPGVGCTAQRAGSGWCLRGGCSLSMEWGSVKQKHFTVKKYLVDVSFHYHRVTCISQFGYIEIGMRLYRVGTKREPCGDSRTGLPVRLGLALLVGENPSSAL